MSLPFAGSSEFAEAGALIGYGVDFLEMCRRAAVFVDKIVKGARPADVPVEQATKFETVLNMRAAKIARRHDTHVDPAAGRPSD